MANLREIRKIGQRAVLIGALTFGGTGCIELRSPVVIKGAETSTPNPTMVGTPTPSEAAGTPALKISAEKFPEASPTTRPMATERPVSAQTVGRELKPGEKMKVLSKSVVMGDVIFKGVRFFDNNERTGLILQVEDEGEVEAPWGASVIHVGADQVTMERVIGQAVEEMKAKGCVRGCDRVDVVKVPGGKPQGQK